MRSLIFWITYVNYSGYALATIARILVIVAAYMGSVPMMLAFTAIASLGMCPLQGDLNAVIASASDYTYLTTGKRIDGTMYSCTSLGVKIGGGLGTAISGWLLAAAGFIEGGVATQPDSVLTMLNVMYLWLPAIRGCCCCHSALHLPPFPDLLRRPAHSHAGDRYDYR